MITIIISAMGLVFAAVLMWQIYTHVDTIEVGFVIFITENETTRVYRSEIFIPFDHLSRYLQVFNRRLFVNQTISIVIEPDLGKKSSAPRLPARYRNSIETILNIEYDD